MMTFPAFLRILRKAALLGAAVIAVAPVWAAQDAAAQRASQQAVIEAISAGRDASALLQNVDSAGGGIATRNTTGKQLAQALAALAAAVNAGDIASIKLAHEQVRASAMLEQSDSQDLKAKLADPSLPAAFESRRAAAQAQLDQLLQQLATAVAAMDGDTDQQADALKALRQALQATSQKQNSAPVLRAALLPVRPLALAARAPLASPAITPSYEGEQDASAGPEDLADAPEAPLNDEILAKTQELGYDYVRIYEYVRNNVRSQWYTGSVKGALGVLRTGSGNAVDQASLLIAMLRAAGAPARYVQGVAEVSVEAVAGAAGLADPSLVPDLLTKAGIAYTPVVQGGRVVLVRIEHTWVAVQVPYTNYRGIVLDATGKTWLPLDVFYKTLQPAPGGVSLAGLGLDWPGLSAQYRAALQDPDFSKDFGAYLRDQVTARLPAPSSPSAYDDAVALPSIKPQTLGLLPNTLAFSVVAVTTESAALPAALRGAARIRVFDDAAGAGNAGLDITLPIHELFNQRATINYIPAELADHRAILLAGGLDLAPVYLFQLRPELRLDGFQRSVGLTPLAGGSTVKFRLDIQTPAGAQSVEQSFLVGAYHAIGVGQSGVTRSPTPSASDSEYDAARLLDGIIQYYEAQWSGFEAGAAQLSGAAIVHPAPSVTIVSNALNLYSVNGLPYTIEWKGVTIDAAAHATGVTAASAAGARDLLAAIGLAGSSLEHGVFESQFQVKSISADKLIAQARAQDIDVLALTSANAPQLAALPLPDAARADLQSFLQLGYSVEIPAQGVAYNAWSGTGWIVSDPASGASGYYLSGGIAGGATTEDPWTLQFLADVLAGAHTDEPNNDPSSGVKVEILSADADLKGTVGQLLTQPMSVRVLDKDGRPVKGASVNFLVSRGGGSVNPASGTTNALGVATATITLGKSTGASPVYIMRNSDDTYATQAGINVFDATVASSVGMLKPDVPLTVLALPDVPATLNVKQITESSAIPGVETTSSMYSVEVLDQYANPVANVSVSGVGLPASANCDPPAATTPATVDGPYKSDTFGVVFLHITPGPTNGTVSPVQVNAGNLSTTIQIQVDTACTAAPGVLSLAWGYFDKDGQTAAATGVGKRYENPFSFQLMQERASAGWNSLHACVYQGTRTFEPVSSASVTLQVSAGGSSLGVTPLGASKWESYVLAGPAPARNDLTWSAGGSYTFDRLMTNGSDTCMTEPVQQSFSLSRATGSVFGVRASIGAITSVVDDATIDPTRLYLSDSGLNVYPIDIPFTLEPPEYKAPAVQMLLFENDQLISVRPSTSKQQQGSTQIERGNRFDILKNYQVSAYINDNIISDKKDLPFKQRIVTSYDHKVRLMRDVDVANDRICEQGGQLDFVLSQSASLALDATALSDDMTNPVPVGSPVRLVTGQHFDVGAGTIPLPPDALLPTRNGYIFTLTAVSDKDGTVETNPGKIDSGLDLNDALPVGNILINGVNVKSGRLVLSGPGFGIAARGPQLALHPSYSSGSSGAVGVLGINWGHNFDASLKTTACGDILINAGDGGFVRFLPVGDGTFTPARGYHGTLIPNFGDHSYDFYSKDGTRYHFVYMGGKRQWALQSITDANGNALALTYDTGIDAPLLRVTNDYGQSLQFIYQSRVFTGTGGPVNVLQKVQGPDGMGLAFEYDDSGNLITITRTDAPELSESYSYSDYTNPLGVPNLLQSVTNALGQTTQFQYNSGPVLRTFGNGQINSFESTVAAIIAADNGKTKFDYNGSADAPATDVTDAMSVVTRYSFNKYGNPLVIDGPAGVTSMTWATNDVLMLSKTDANNVVTKYTYDAGGNQTSEQVMGAGGATSAQTWLAQTAPPFIKSKRTSATDRNGKTTGYDYDGHGNLKEEKRPDGGSVSYTTATNGDVLSSTDARHNTTSYHYDGRGMRTDVIAPIGTTTTAYDSRGRPTAIVDAEGRKTQMVYNTLDQLTDVTLAAGTPQAGHRHTDWDLLGNKLSETDEEGRVTSYRYDDMNRVVHKALPIGAVDTTWDRNGNKTSETNLRGDATTYDYDTANRLIRRTEPATPAKVTQYQYDGVGNITLETDALSRQTRYTYNVLNQRTDTAYLNDHTATHADYDGNGNKVRETDELGRVTTRVFDPLNRLTDQTIDTSVGPSHRHMTWDYNGNKTSETDELGNPTTYEYDALNRLVKQTDALTGHTDIDYDSVGNKLQVTDPLRHAQKWQYNARNWVETAQDGEGNQTQYSYDKVGNKLTETWPNTNTIQYDYDALNRQTASRDSLGSVSQATWDPDGNKTSETDGNGHTIAYEWDAIGRQKSRSQTTAVGTATTSTDYDAAGNPVTVTDPNGNATHTDYDSRNRPVKVYDSIGTISETTYDAVGNPLTVTDGRGHVLNYTYNELNLRTSTSDAWGVIEANTYDRHGNKTDTTDANGNLTKYKYDAMNRVTLTTRAGVQIKKTDYDEAGNVQFETDANGNQVGYEYDKRNLLVKTNRFLGAIDQLKRDEMGDVTLATDPENRNTKTDYDKRRRPVKVTDGEGNATQNTYDLAGNLTNVQPPTGTATGYDYDQANRLMKIRQPMEASRTYDKNGNLTAQTDLNGNSTGYTYDPRNRRIKKTLPGGAYETSGYDGANGLTSHQDANGNRFIHTLDPRGRRTDTSVSASGANSTGSITSTHYGYDNNGNLTSTAQTDSNGTRTDSTTWDAFDRPYKVTDAWGNTLTHGYDAQGNRTSTTAGTLASAGGSLTSTTFDQLNRPTAQTGPGGTTNIGYDKSSKIVKITYPDGSSNATSYDDAGRVKTETGSTSTTAGPGNTIASATYTYDPNGNRIQSDRTESLSQNNRSAELSATLPGGTSPSNYTRTRTETWTYDPQNRLTSHDTPERSVHWQLDAGGRRVQQTVMATVGTTGPPVNPLEASTQTAGTTQYTYNERDQLVQISGAQTANYTYDANGNRTSQTQTIGSNTTTINYRWNAQDQLISVEQGSTPLATYRYTASNLRAEKILTNAGIAAATTGNAGANNPLAYERTQWDGIHARRSFEVNGSSQTLRSDTDAALFGQDAAPLLLNRTNYANGLGSPSSTTQLLTDANGTLIATVTDEAGTAQADSLLLYSPYGLIDTEASGNGATALQSNGNSFGSYYADPETGLLYARARYYDPASGQFISRDPMEGEDRLPITWGAYQYGRYNPYSFSDPTGKCDSIGLCATRVAGGLVGGIGLTAIKMVESGYALAEVQYDAQRSLFDASARQRTIERANLAVAIAANADKIPGALKEAIVNVDKAAQAEDLNGNPFMAAILRGNYGGEFALSVVGVGEAGLGAVNLARNLATVGREGALLAPQIARVGASAGPEAAAAAARNANAGVDAAQTLARVDSATPTLVRQMSSSPGVTGESLPLVKSVPPASSGPPLVGSPGETSANRGVHYVLENSSKSLRAQAYEDALPGTTYDIATQKRWTPALKFDNPNLNGRSEIRFDGVDLDNPMILVDRKLNATTHSKQMADMQRWAEGLRQNPEYSVRVEVPTQSAYRNMMRLIERARVQDAPITVRITP